MKLTSCLFALLLVPVLISAQINCSNPKVVNLCPSVYLIGETNAGMIDDVGLPCNLPGEDVLYQINAPNGAGHIYVSILNATGALECTLEQGSCGSGNCNTQFLSAGSSNINFTVANSTQYFLWVNATGSITYDISIGGDTGTAVVNIPNTKGNLQLDSSICAVPVFNPVKPFFQVSYNSIYKTLPMTLSPLSVPGTMCITTYFKNTAGVEGIKQFEFDFNPLGYSNVSPQAVSFPGFYNAGNWQATQTGSKWKFVFVDGAGTGRGDFTGIPNTCLRYAFCFTVTPLSNIPALTNVDVLAKSDGYGSAYTTTVNTGCCPIGFLSCLGGSGGGPVAGAASAFGFGFDDPGGALPVVLTSFTTELIDNTVLVRWSTQSQTNNDYFTIEKSKDKNEWEQLSIIKGAGNSNMVLEYSVIDKIPYRGLSYYRLKQTDFNGAFSFSKLSEVFIGNEREWMVFPNPSAEFLLVIGQSLNQVRLYDCSGKEILLQPVHLENGFKYNLKNLKAGVYFIEGSGNKITATRKKVIVIQ